MIRKAFTMLELVMVIVVMGIVAVIGSDIIATLYQNYLKTQSISKLQAQTELALDQIAKRLQYRIKDSVIARDADGANPYIELSALTNQNYEILEWIGKSNEAFIGEHNGTRVVPGWSGFIDLDAVETNATSGTLKTSGSRLDYANQIISSLSYGEVDLNASAVSQRPAIIFKGKDTFNINNYGWNGVDGNYTYRVTMQANDILDINETLPNTIYEQYDLAWSAYALVPVGNAGDFNLTLHYNYQPWHNETYDANTTRVAVLLEHVSSFRFKQIGETINIKLCVGDANQSGDYDFGFCKEKVIF